MPVKKEQYICILKVSVITCYGEPGPYRIIAILGRSTLYTLAWAITRAFNFDFDHLFGFYSSIHNYSHSNEWYEYYLDTGDEPPDAEYTTDVKKAKVSEVFDSVGKEMLFHYDFGDDWRFLVEFMGKEPREEGKRYPAVIERVGKGPRQYEESSLYFGLEEVEVDENQKSLDEFQNRHQNNREDRTQHHQKNLDDCL
jgi:hypothetical protein